MLEERGKDTATTTTITTDSTKEDGMAATAITKAAVKATTTERAITVNNQDTSRPRAHNYSGNNNNYKVSNATIAKGGATGKEIAPKGKEKGRQELME